uniref:ABC-transporter N-terminal domain-containing protein n=1 Tax=Leersia perrieri TaxID=77586 RepID=A0A0D9V1K2_9ORYZ
MHEHHMAAVEAEKEARLLVERMVGVTGNDHERFLLRIKDRFDSVGLELPTIEVHAKGLAVEAEAYAWRLQATPTVFSSIANTVLVSGKVAYNGHEMEEFVPDRTAAYISQEDLHAGEMTVRETRL